MNLASPGTVTYASIILIIQHVFIIDKHERQNLVGACPDSLFVDVVISGLPSIKPGIGSDFSGQRLVRFAAEKYIEGEAVAVKRILRKSARRNGRRACEPFSAITAMTNKQGRRVISFDKSNGNGRVTDIEDIGKVTYRCEVELRVLPKGWSEEIVRHNEIGRVTVRDALCRCQVVWLEVVRATHKRSAAVKTPMSEFMSDRKAFAAAGTALVDRNNGHIVMANDPRLASIEWPMVNASSNMERDRLKVDFVWLRDAQFLEKALRRRQARHGCSSASFSGGKTPSSLRSSRMPRTS